MKIGVGKLTVGEREAVSLQNEIDFTVSSSLAIRLIDSLGIAPNDGRMFLRTSR